MTRTFAVCVVGTLISFAACSGSEKKQASESDAGDNAAGLNGRNPIWKLTLLDGTCQ